MKIKIGLYAPTKVQYKATGTDGTPSPGNQTPNLNEKEGKLLPFSPTPRVGSSTVGSGAEVTEVDEPHVSISGTLFRSEPVFQAEFEVVAEPKALLPGDLRNLVKKHGGYSKAGLAIGASEAFIRQNSGLPRKSSKNRVR